jgi:hypothetical protein
LWQKPQVCYAGYAARRQKKNRKTVKKGHEGPFFWEKEDALMAFFCAVF